MNFVITAGHSNRDPGAVGQNTTEAAIVTEMRNMVASHLRTIGHTVYTDGEGDTNQELCEAIKLIGKGSVAIEFHCNAASSSGATGVETIGLPKDKVLCQRLSSAIAGVLKQKLRGDKGYIGQGDSARGRLGYVSAGGIIIELFFLSNKGDYLFYEVNKSRVADAIVKVLVNP